MTISNVDNTTLNNLAPNLDVGDVADPALRLSAFQYIYTYLQTIATDLNNLQVAGAIGTNNLANLSVTASKLANLAVETAKIADLAVTTGKINDLAVTLGKIATGAVDSTKMADLAVVTSKLNDLAVTTAKLAAGSVTTDKLADGSVTSPKIATGAVGSTQLSDGGVTRAKIASQAVGASQIDATLLNNFGDIAVQAEFDRRGIDVMKYGAKGDGVTDDTSSIQSALTAGAGSIVILPKGNYKISSTLTIPDNTIIFAYGARIFNTTTHITMLRLGSNSKIYGLELEGAGNSSYNAFGIGIEVKGSYDSTITYVSEVTLQDCYIHDFGAYGIYAEYAKHVHVIGCRIYDIGYGGIGGLSVENMHVYGKTHVKGLSPGTSGNAYGIYYTRNSAIDSLDQCPRSKSCSVVDCLIEDNTLWEALDTHAGEDIQFINNTIKNCNTGIAIVSCPDSNSDPRYGAINCKAMGNTIYGLGTGIGIVLQGAIDVIGSPAEYSENNSILNNIIINAGERTHDTTGGIVIYGTRSTTIAGNNVKDCYPHGIVAYHTNVGFTIQGNTVVDPQDTTSPIVSCIIVRSTHNSGVISGNNLMKVAANTVDPPLTVAKRGITLSTVTNNSLVIGPNFNSAELKQVGTDGAGVTFGAQIGSGDTFIYSSNGAPSIAATPGCLCINKAGGTGTTLYVKETGSGTSGWVAK